MIWLALLVAVVLVVLTVAAVLGRVDGSLADVTSTMSHVALPEDPLTVADIEGLRFDTAFRGYRMSEVDAVIDRLRREISDLSAPVDRVATPLLPGLTQVPSDPHESASYESATYESDTYESDTHESEDARSTGNVDVAAD